MSTTIRSIRLAACALGLVAQAAFAYETPVHREMTRSAFTRAVRDRDFLKDLGVLHLFDADGNLATEAFAGDTALGWAMSGSMSEDNFIRSLFHFYDPLAPTGSQGLFGSFQAAPDWAFNAADNATYSLPGTRDSLYGALTNTDTIVRPKKWRDTFRGVGQFTHLLQDMAQPQHVRNDDHFSLTEQFYYLFPDYSRYEKRTLFTLRTLNFGGYPSVRLPTYRSYWNTADGRGLAQVTNRNFVSEGTNLDTGRYASPQGTLLDEEVIAQVLDLRNQSVIATNVTVQYAANSFTDPYTGAPEINERLSTFSLFDFERMQTVARHAYTLYNTNHDRYAQLLVPRAVGYSAGLIGRFFRGSLAITAPDEKIYAIVDHSTIHQTDPMSGFVGFDKIKLKVRDASPAGEAMSGGKLVAVAKFHRNGCYKDDLSGEFITLTAPCTNNSYRTDTEEIVVSSNSFDGVSLSKTTPTPLTFTFAQQIPINATDLYIQVVYRGAFGNDPDEVVVGTKDVFEPTYLALYNSTDQILFNGTFTDTTSPTLLDTLDKNPQDGVIDSPWDRTNLNVSLSFVNFNDPPLAFVQDLPPARYSRVALITDQDPYFAAIRTSGVAFGTIGAPGYGPESNQLDVERNTYLVAVFAPLRGVNSFDSYSLFRVFGTPTEGDLTTLPALTNKAPFPVTTLIFQ